MQVYENVLRVPFLIKGPGIAPGTSWDGIAGFVDLMPTIIDLATGNAPEDADGRSFAPFIIPTLSKPTKPWKTVHLTTYQSINTNDCIWTAPGVNASNVVLDNVWLWRADVDNGKRVRDCKHSLVVNGDNVTAYGLAAEHVQSDNVVWNGEGGNVFFYQAELDGG